MIQVVMEKLSPLVAICLFSIYTLVITKSQISNKFYLHILKTDALLYDKSYS